MNPELIRLLDQYLNNELSPEDTQIVADRIANDPNLKLELDRMMNIRATAKRAAQRNEIVTTAKSFHFMKNVKSLALGAAIVTALTFGVIAIVNKVRDAKDTASSINKELALKYDKQKAMEFVPTEYFQLTGEDTVVLSKNGVLLSVPSGAFLQNGVPYTKAVVVQFQEAMDDATIVKGALSTMAGDRLLETQGMFGLKAFDENGKLLEMNPKIGVYVQVPVAEQKKGMQLFTGKPDAKGNIDWKDPQPLEKIPTMVNMKDLDFYPSGYETALNNKKWSQDKAARDSLYLSFDEMGQIEIEQSVTNAPIAIEKEVKFWTPVRTLTVAESKYLYGHQSVPVGNNITMDEARKLAKSPKPAADLIYSKEDIANSEKWIEKDASAAVSAYAKVAYPNKYVKPSEVLAIWKSKFNNTILATKEFEERMQAIHDYCGHNIIQKYASQLDKPLWQIDAEVVKMGYPGFAYFAEQRVGKVDITNKHFQNLQSFYQKSVKQLQASNKKLQEQAREKESAWDEKVQKVKTEEVQNTQKREVENVREEFDINLKDVKRQLGYDQKVRRQVSGTTVSFVMTQNMRTVYNIDKYVMDATVARKSTTIKDPLSNKTAEIIYNDFDISVKNPKQYDRLYLYLFPDQFNSFQRLDPVDGVINYPLNNLLSYNIAFVGFNKEGIFWSEQSGVKSGSQGQKVLEKISEKELDRKLAKLNKNRGGEEAKLFEELNFIKTTQQNYVVQALRIENAKFRSELIAILFKCRVEQID